MTAVDWLVRSIAHRGLHDAQAGIVENTRTAFEEAIRAGYAIECDVQACRGGEPVVFHDASLERLTRSRGALASRSAAQLAKVSFRDSGDRIQTLPELLDQVGGRVPLAIEVKTDWKHHGPFERKIADQLRAYDGKAAVMSFDPCCMAAFADYAPEIARGLIACRFTGEDPEWDGLSYWQRFRMRHLLTAAIAKPDFIAYDIKALPAFAPVAGRIWPRWPLLTWTVRTRAERRRARRWADAIIFEGMRPKP